MMKTSVCVFCRGKAELRFEDLHLLDGKIVLQAQPHYSCQDCGREYTTSEQMAITEKSIKSFK